MPLIALVVVAATLSAVTAGVLMAQQNVPSSGNIAGQITSSINVGVYSDPTATTLASNIDWGTLNPGGSVTRTVYIKNTGNVTETLSMTTSSWTPASASNVLSLSWDKEGTSLTAGNIVAASLTLSVSSNPGTITSFSFNIVITGTA